MTQAAFDKTLKNISGLAEALAVDVHNAGLYCLTQANIYNNANEGQRLIEAIGNKQDKQRVGRWLVFFGKFAVKSDMLVYKKRKDITEANAEGWVKRADEMPYWELTPQPKLLVTFDYLAMIQSIINRASKVTELEEEGKQVTEKNKDVLKELNKIMIAYAPKDKLPEIKKTIAKAASPVKEAESVPEDIHPVKVPAKRQSRVAHH